MIIECPHCNKPFEEYDNIQEVETEVVDDRVYVTTTYWYENPIEPI